jgi:hypothetical protein
MLKDNLEKKVKLRKTIADTMSMISFSFVVEAPRELLIGMSLEQTLYSRLSGIPIDLCIGRPYGIYLDWLRKKFNVEEVKGIVNKKRLKRTVVDSFAFLTFMAPIYAGMLYVIGVNENTIATAVASGAVYSTIQGAPYGIYRDFIRKKMKAN